MKKSIYLMTAVSLLVCISACTSYDYYTAAINKTNLSNYHSFAWMPQANNGNKGMNSDVADVKIKDEATQALVAKGLRLSQRNPDLIVNYSIKVAQGARTNYYTGYYGGYPGWGWGGGLGWGFGGRWGWGYRPYYYAYGAPFYYGPTFAEKEHFKEGTLIIDLVDSRTHRIVWRGFGVGEVHRNPEKTIEDLPKVVDGILGQLQLYPEGEMRYRRS